MLACVDVDTAEARLQRVTELQEFTETCRKHLEHVFTELQWRPPCEPQTESDLEELVQCPFDPGHRVPRRSLEKHKESCHLKKMNYSSEEQEQMPDTSFCYKNTNVRTFVMDKMTQHQVILQARSAAPLMKMEGVFWQGQYSGEPVEVPQNHKRALCDLTVADRLALYDHVTSKLSSQEEAAPSSSNEDLYVDLVKKLQKDEEQKEPKTHLELMAEMRDYKRRRQSYRAKNVHITKKSYTEVIREVINVHSEELSRQWRDEGIDRSRRGRGEGSDRSRQGRDEGPDRSKREGSDRSREWREEGPDRGRQGKEERSDRSRQEGPDRSREWREEGSDRSREWREEGSDRSREWREEGSDRSRHRDGEPKKKKKKRQRDSRSPDDHHKHKKKKKKGKREEREREEKEDK
ncbi:U11/U12 small nuclear ribonucleoprotein 48 kDa protein isoform X2 [Boleophthalmus pectinirostris]|uniref:U11/U12 small nuclear ribonucleoprotein 48 kDa protein isoform X2 n=1 Tax=Boleophthalmus pectinirostris TaxID=150288 RepID=UPI00242CC3E0|nr:U11/U12 small nuclear ribonucleoprotein 48 kDa protein isoform X2 [Boleophthalmus pectinirostris]